MTSAPDPLVVQSTKIRQSEKAQLQKLAVRAGVKTSAMVASILRSHLESLARPSRMAAKGGQG